VDVIGKGGLAGALLIQGAEQTEEFRRFAQAADVAHRDRLAAVVGEVPARMCIGFPRDEVT